MSVGHSLNPKFKAIRRFLRSILSIAVITIATSASTSLQAQLVEFRPIPGFHWSSHIGITTYAGEFDASSTDRSAVGFGVSNSLTYQLSQVFGIGVGHTLALHPRIPDPSGRHNIQAFLIVQHARQRVTPFFKIGASNTIGGKILGFGPHLGFGLNIISSGTFSLFQETTINMVFPGSAVDGQSFSGGFDSIGTVGVGIKITDLGGFFGTRNIGLDEIFSSAEASNYRVRPGEAVNFSSGAKDESKVEFNWNFGDGFEESGKSVEHIFQQPGLYEVSLSAQNAGVSEEKSVFISVQDEALIAMATEVEEPGSPDLLTSGVDTIEGPVIESRPFSYASQIEPEQEQEPESSDDDPRVIVDDPIAEIIENEDPDININETAAKPKRTRVIILDGVRIEEEIPEDELPKSGKALADLDPIPSLETQSGGIADTLPTDTRNEVDETVNEVPNPEPVEEAEVETASTSVAEAQSNEPIIEEIQEEITEVQSEEVESESTKDTEPEDEVTTDITADTNTETEPETTNDAPIQADIQTTIIIVDGQEIEVEASSLKEEKRESTNDIAPDPDYVPLPIDREKLDEGVFTWVLAIYPSYDDATNTANQIGENTFVVEMRPEHEMFRIFSFHTKDGSARISYLTTFGAFETKQDAIDAMNDIPFEFQERPFMMEIRRF